jgi:GGDEF domain-containing protein
LNIGETLGRSVSFRWVAIFPEHSPTVEGILKKAEEALYYANHNGRDRVEVAK